MPRAWRFVPRFSQHGAGGWKVPDEEVDKPGAASVSPHAQQVERESSWNFLSLQGHAKVPRGVVGWKKAQVWMRGVQIALPLRLAWSWGRNWAWMCPTPAHQCMVCCDQVGWLTPLQMLVSAGRCMWTRYISPAAKISWNPLGKFYYLQRRRKMEKSGRILSWHNIYSMRQF